jgi:hypothetical protein
MQTAGKFINATVNSVGVKQRNDEFELEVTISNRGTHSATVSVWLQARSNDNDSQELLHWWREHKISAVLEVEKDRKKTEKFQLKVPAQTKPIVYHYDVWISAPDYLDRELRLPQQLHIRPSIEKGKKPDWEIISIKKIESFSLDRMSSQIVPATMRDKPHPIPRGESAMVEVRVENRSGLVQRYTLECDLPDDWYKIQYPIGDALNLNPNANHIGSINLVLTPPESARAGVYSPTIRLYCDLDGDRDVQIDIIYFEIPAVRDLQLALTPTPIYLPQQPGKLHAAVTNQGNAPERIALYLDSIGHSHLKYDLPLGPEGRLLEPGGEPLTLPIWVALQRWKAPLRLKDKILPFELKLIASNDTDTDTGISPQDAQTVRGEVVWQRTPGWVWWLLLLLLLLALGGLAWGLWMMLKLPPSPKIEGFTASRTDQGEDVLKSEILLAFTVRNACNLGSLTLTSINAKGERTSNRFAGTTIGAAVFQSSAVKSKVCGQEKKEKEKQTYLVETPTQTSDPNTSSTSRDSSSNITQNTSTAKKNIFKFEKCTPVENEEESLNCMFKVENLPPANDYTFEVQAFPTPAPNQLKRFTSKNSAFRKLGICRDRCERETDKPTDTEFTESVAISPILPLQIHNLKADVRATPGDRKIVSISWTLHNLKTLEKLHVIRTEAQGKSEIHTYQYSNNKISASSNLNINIDCQSNGETQLDCTWKQSNRLAPGTYKYRIEVFSKQNPHEVADRQETQNTIIIAPPKLDRFALVPFPYVGGETPIFFNFAIDNPRQIKTLILQAISPETSQTQELQRYDFNSDSENFLPTELQGCQVVAPQNTPQLQCVNVPISPLPIGQYQFALIAISQQEGAAPMSLQSDAIVVRPPSVGSNAAGNFGNGRDRALAGIDFKINGKPVGENPTNFLFAIAPNGAPTLIDLTWEIKGAGDRHLQVSLSPLLDSADPQGSLQFALQGAPSQQLFTLQVINELGEVESRTALIQTYPSASSSAPPPPPPDRSSDNPPNSPGLPLPPPPTRDKLRPLEVPPTLD